MLMLRPETHCLNPSSKKNGKSVCQQSIPNKDFAFTLKWRFSAVFILLVISLFSTFPSFRDLAVLLCHYKVLVAAVTKEMKTKAYETPTVKIEGRSGGYTLIEKTQNLQEQKESFLRNGTTPTFYHHEHMKQNPPGKSAEIRFDLLGEAEFILNKVKQHYGNGERFLNHMFGPYISQEQANNILMDYIRENSLQESLNVYWSNNMTCRWSIIRICFTCIAFVKCIIY